MNPANFDTASLRSGVRQFARMLERESVDFGNIAGVPIWRPHPENAPQQQALLSEADELLYGGAAGGGKTDLGIGLALTEHRRSLILRRVGADLQYILERCTELVESHPQGVRSGRTFRIPPLRQIKIGGIKEPGDYRKYMGDPRDLLVWDELVQFTQPQFRALRAWNRTKVVGQRVRLLAATNPPVEASGRWVLEEWAPWIDPHYAGERARPGELRWFVYDDADRLVWSSDSERPEPFRLGDGSTLEWKSRTFIPSRVDDNPYYRDTGYRAQLDSLPSRLRRAWRDADWTVADEDRGTDRSLFPPAIVGPHVVRDRPDVETAVQVGIDVARGGADRTAIAYHYREPDGRSYVEVDSFPHTPTGASIVMLLQENLRKIQPGALVVYDVIGVGAALEDAFFGTDYDATPFVGSGRTYARDRSGMLRFANLRSQALYQLRERLESGTLRLAYNDRLLRQLEAYEYTVSTTGIQVSSSQSVARVVGHSPDETVAVALATFEPAPMMVTTEPTEEAADVQVRRALDRHMAALLMDDGDDEPF